MDNTEKSILLFFLSGIFASLLVIMVFQIIQVVR